MRSYNDTKVQYMSRLGLLEDLLAAEPSIRRSSFSSSPFRDLQQTEIYESPFPTIVTRNTIVGQFGQAFEMISSLDPLSNAGGIYV